MMPDAASKSPRRAMKRGMLLGVGLLLGACTALPQTPPPNPNTFFARLTQDGVRGTYDPSGFTAEEVQKGIGQICAHRQIADYREQPVAGGMGFSGRCIGGSEVLMGTTKFTRFRDRLRIEIPGYPYLEYEDNVTWSIRL